MTTKRSLKYVRWGPLVSLLTVALIAGGLLASPAGAQAPTCQSAASDSDGDGWGWENNASCIVADSSNGSSNSGSSNNGSSNNGSTSTSQGIDTPTRIECANDFDPDGDGWGWENNQSCAHRPQAPTNLSIDSSGSILGATLTWDAVPGAAGYILYRDGQAFSEITGTSAPVGLLGPANYFVRSFRSGKSALSHASRPIQWNNDLAPVVTPDTDELIERGCRTGAPGENFGAELVRGSFRVGLFTVVPGDVFFEPTDVVGTNYFQVNADFVSDCDAERHVLELRDQRGLLVETFETDGALGGLGLPARRPVNDTSYTIVVTSHFFDGTTETSNTIVFTVQGK